MPVHDTKPREFPQVEACSGRYLATLTDETGATLPGSSLATLTLTLYTDDTTETIINGRNAQNVLNANGVTVTDDPTNNIDWRISPADNAIINDALPVERHVALFAYTWGVDSAGKHEVVLVVRNLRKVP